MVSLTSPKRGIVIKPTQACFVRQVISSVTTDNAIGGQNTTTYKYGKAKVNIKGRGNLGFGWIEKKDLQSNKITRTEYNQYILWLQQLEQYKDKIDYIECGWVC